MLQNSGFLPTGRVTAAQRTPSGAFNSRTEFLSLYYSKNAPQSAPTKLVLKRNGVEGWSMQAGAEEVHFYSLASVLPGHPEIIPPCYGAGYDPASRASFLLLQDLSETHAPPITREQQISITQGIPAPAHQDAVIDTLAALHAYWWDHPMAKTSEFQVCYWSLSADRFTQYLTRRKAAWQRLVERNGSRIASGTKEFYDQLFGRLPRYFAETLRPRLSTRRNLTLTHGDAYFCNFLCPKSPEYSTTYLMDWQSPSFELAAYDLVNLLATFWTRSQRHEADLEISRLQRYYRSLQARGVRDYSWGELLEDYRAGLIFWVLMPVQDGGDGAVPSYWQPKMECLVAAFEDWNCWQVLAS